ncbi:MAG TPA: beta-phosphoglucomutase family hydrolase [Cellvibrio sp.]|nr:beta-phosphoglucomutase family hydrolase [Cellvibrio sp.]
MYDQFDALIFDMDGTLVDSGQLHERAWIATLTHYQIPVDRPFMRSLAGVSTMASIEILLKKFNCNPAAHLSEISEFKERYVEDHLKALVKPTALMETVRQYHGKKPMAIGTGASRREAEKIIAACGLDKYIHCLVSADQVKNPKPAPDTFLRCAQLLGVMPERCVVFEDAKLGLQAAVAAGMAGVDVLRVHNIINDYFL